MPENGSARVGDAFNIAWQLGCNRVEDTALVAKLVIFCRMEGVTVAVEGINPLDHNPGAVVYQLREFVMVQDMVFPGHKGRGHAHTRLRTHVPVGQVGNVAGDPAKVEGARERTTTDHFGVLKV